MINFILQIKRYDMNFRCKPIYIQSFINLAREWKSFCIELKLFYKFVLKVDIFLTVTCKGYVLEKYVLEKKKKKTMIFD